MIAARLRAVLLEPGIVTAAEWRRGMWSPVVVCGLALLLAIGAATVAPVGAPDPASPKISLTGEARDGLAAPGAVDALGRERFDRMTADVGAVAAHVVRAVVRLTPVLMAVLIPLLALCTRAAWSPREWVYGLHLRLALDVNAAWFVALAASLLAAVMPSTFVATAASLVGIGYSTWYCAAAWRVAFGGVPSGVWRSTVAALGYALALTCGMYAVIVYAVVTY